MIEDEDLPPPAPDLDPNWAPLFGQKEPPGRHRVKASTRTLPPKPQAPSEPSLFPWPEPEPQPRVIPVRPHLRRNPRRQGATMQSLTPAPDDPPIGRARPNDPSTSHVAGALTNLPKRQIQVLSAFQGAYLVARFAGSGHGGWTDEEMVAKIEAAHRAAGQNSPSPSGLRTARKVLADAGFLEPLPKTRPTRSGREAFVWVLTEKGRKARVPA